MPCSDVQAAAVPVRSDQKVAKCTLDTTTQALLKLIFDQDMFKDAMKKFDIDVKKMPLGKLSKSQIAKVRVVVNVACIVCFSFFKLEFFFLFDEFFVCSGFKATRCWLFFMTLWITITRWEDLCVSDLCLEWSYAFTVFPLCQAVSFNLDTLCRGQYLYLWHSNEL